MNLAKWMILLGSLATFSRPLLADGDSTANRKNKVIDAGAEIGLVDIRAGYGANAGYFLTPDSILEVDYFHSNFAFLGLQSTVDLFTAKYKWFVGNSFFIQGGIGQRHMVSVDNPQVITLTSANSSTISSGPYKATFTANHIVAELGIGNRWQFDNFFIGCDWVGNIQPLSKLSSSESVQGQPTTPTETTDDENNFNKASKNGNLLLVRFHIGWAF